MSTPQAPISHHSAKMFLDEQSGMSHSALLQLAEICTSELQNSNEDKPYSSHPHPSDLTSTQAQLHNCISGCSHPKPPPKKRARHWSITENDTFSHSSSGRYNKEIISHILGSLSPQNMIAHEPKWTSAVLDGSLEHFSDVGKNKLVSTKQNLSTPATQLILLPTVISSDGMQEDVPAVFPPDVANIENFVSFVESKLARQKIFDQKSSLISDFLRRDLHSFNELTVNNLNLNNGQLLIHNKSTPSQPSILEQREQKNQILIQHHEKPAQFSQALNLSTGEISKPQILPEKGPEDSSGSLRPASQIMECSQHKSHFSRCLCKFGVNEPELKNGHPHLYLPRETEKSEVTDKKSQSESIKHQLSSLSQNCSMPVLKHSLSAGPATDYKHFIQTITARFEPQSKTQTILEPTADLKSAICSLLVGKPSVPSEGKLASLLSKNDSPHSTFANNIPGHLSIVDKNTNNSNRSRLKGIKNRMLDTGKINEQSIQSMQLPTVDLPYSELVHLHRDSSSSLSRLPPTAQIFREGKLKKKWTERMLKETKKDKVFCTADGIDSLAVFISDENVQDLCKNANHGTKPHKSSEFTRLNDKLIASLLQQNQNFRGCNGPDVASSGISQTKSLLSQQFDSLKAKPIGLHSPPLFHADSHPKLRQQLSQNHQSFRQDQPQLLGTKMKPEHISDTTSFSKHCNVSGFSLQPNTGCCFDGVESTVSNSNLNVSKSVSCKPVMSDIAACGKKIVDHIVEQLCKADFSKNQKLKTDSVRNEQLHKADLSRDEHLCKADFSREEQLCKADFSTDELLCKTNFARKEPLSKGDFFREERTVKTEFCVYNQHATKTPGCSVSNSLQHGERSPKTMAKLDQDQDCGSLISAVIEENQEKVMKEEIERDISPEEKIHFNKVSSLSTYKDESKCNWTMDQCVSSLIHIDLKDTENTLFKFNILPDQARATCESTGTLETFQQGTMGLSNGDQSQEMPADASSLDVSSVIIQPVRKSERQNRGQKYQELIKEGFIQPSRERLAAMNVQRHVKNQMSKEESDRVVPKRNIKRPPNERNAQLETLAAGIGRKCSGNSDQKNDVTSPSVIGYSNEPKIKTFKAKPHQRDSTNVHVVLTQKSPVEHHRSELPTLYTPATKTDQSTEQVTGSRKRKARKRCITRISVMDEAEEPIKKSDVMQLAHSPLRKQCLTMSLAQDSHSSMAVPNTNATSGNMRVIEDVKSELLLGNLTQYNTDSRLSISIQAGDTTDLGSFPPISPENCKSLSHVTTNSSINDAISSLPPSSLFVSATSYSILSSQISYPEDKVLKTNISKESPLTVVSKDNITPKNRNHIVESTEITLCAPITSSILFSSNREETSSLSKYVTLANKTNDHIVSHLEETQRLSCKVVLQTSADKETPHSILKSGTYLLKSKINQEAEIPPIHDDSNLSDAGDIPDALKIGDSLKSPLVSSFLDHSSVRDSIRPID